MAFRLEAELREPIAAWLVDAGYDVHLEVPVLGRRADILGVRADHLLAVEMKLEDWATALRQAIAYQLAADAAWVAMPLASAIRAYRHRWRFETEAVGLLAVDDAGRVRTPIPAGTSPRVLPFATSALRLDLETTAEMNRVFSKGEISLQAF